MTQDVNEEQTQEIREMITSAALSLAKSVVAEVEASSYVTQARGTEEVDSILGKWSLQIDYEGQGKIIFISGDLWPNHDEGSMTNPIFMIFSAEESFSWHMPVEWLYKVSPDD